MVEVGTILDSSVPPSILEFENRQPFFPRQTRPLIERRESRMRQHDAHIVGFAERIDALTEMQENMEEAIIANPDITQGALFLISQKFKGRVRDEDLAVAHEASHIYDERHNAVEWARVAPNG